MDTDVAGEDSYGVGSTMYGNDVDHERQHYNPTERAFRVSGSVALWADDERTQARTQCLSNHQPWNKWMQLTRSARARNRGPCS